MIKCKIEIVFNSPCSDSDSCSYRDNDSIEKLDFFKINLSQLALLYLGWRGLANDGICPRAKETWQAIGKELEKRNHPYDPQDPIFTII